MTTVNVNEGLNSSLHSWKRPEGPPRIWRIVNGRKKTADGEILRFSIQELPEELNDDAVDFMIKYFIVEEPLCVDTSTASNPQAVREFRILWKNALGQRASVVALTVNTDPSTKPVIAGINILNVVTAEDKANSRNMMEVHIDGDERSEAVKKIIDVMFNLSDEANSLKKYGVDRYLSGFGLSVHPSFRGQGIGEELLRARDDIGLAYQIPMSETVFTATASQILATRAGYEVLIERNYSELLDDEGKVTFPGVTVKSIKVMAKRLY